MAPWWLTTGTVSCFLFVLASSDYRKTEEFQLVFAPLLLYSKREERRNVFHGMRYIGTLLSTLSTILTNNNPRKIVPSRLCSYKSSSSFRSNYYNQYHFSCWLYVLVVVLLCGKNAFVTCIHPTSRTKDIPIKEAIIGAPAFTCAPKYQNSKQRVQQLHQVFFSKRCQQPFLGHNEINADNNLRSYYGSKLLNGSELSFFRTRTSSLSTTWSSVEKESTAESSSSSSSSSSSTTQRRQNLAEETISDVDARVLQSLLVDSKLDIKTEEGVRKLLERGIVKNIPSVATNVRGEDDDSDYSSTVLKTLADTKLWKSLKAKSNKLLESVGLWVVNKVEQDVKVLAALGLFAWDRAVRDVARALPEAKEQVGRASKVILLLSNSSSYNDMKFTNVQTEWNRNKERKRNKEPAALDEIKSVSRDIFEIVSGQQVIGGVTSSATSGRRGLRTAAPAGGSSTAVSERQRRAYMQSQKVNQQRKDVTRIPSAVVDTAWEVKRELKAERNIPGYKTEPIRRAISAVAVETGNILRDAATEARLVASKRKDLNLLKEQKQFSNSIHEDHPATDAATTATTTSLNSAKRSKERSAAGDNYDYDINQAQTLVNQIQDEVDILADRINQCIHIPGETWLREYEGDNLSDLPSEPADLRDVVTRMILVRNQVESETIQPFLRSNVKKRLKDLVAIQQSINDLCSQTSTVLSPTIGKSLEHFLLYGNVADKQADGGYVSVPLFLRLDQFSIEFETALRLTVKKNGVQRVSTTTDGAASSSLAEETTQAASSSSPGNAFAGRGVFFAQVQKVDLPTSKVSAKVASSSPSSNVANFFDPILSTTTVNAHSIMDVVPVRTAEMFDIGFPIVSPTAASPNDAGSRVAAEIVSNDDYETALGASKKTRLVSDYDLEQESKKENDISSMILAATLRSVDVVLIVVEKLLTVGVPATIALVSTIASRLEGVRSEGNGSKGWKKYDKLSNNARGRY